VGSKQPSTNGLSDISFTEIKLELIRKCD